MTQQHRINYLGVEGGEHANIAAKAFSRREDRYTALVDFIAFGMAIFEDHDNWIRVLPHIYNLSCIKQIDCKPVAWLHWARREVRWTVTSSRSGEF
jgi:hypothetical protein